MSTADKLALLLATKESQRIKLGLAKSVPFSAYVDYMKKVDPKLSANFVTNTYAKSGVASTFADAFTFNRAGKAWLFKNEDLLVYGVDVPRFDNGLLIEREVTNHARKELNRTSTIYKSTALSKNRTKIEAIKDYTGQILNQLTTPEYPVGSSAGADGYIYSSIYLHETDDNILFGQNGLFKASASASFLTRVGSGAGSALTRQYRMGVGKASRGSNVISTVGNYAIYSCQMYCLVAESDFVSEPILASSTPVTRPADFLQSKVTGTTITGDWDSTLSLSIVDGQIVHSGYGRIRSLEIN